MENNRKRFSVPINGIDTSSPALTVKDGNCAELHNLRYSGGAWRVVAPFREIVWIFDSQDFRILYKHPTTEANRFIALNKAAEGYQIVEASYVRKFGTTTYVWRKEQKIMDASYLTSYKVDHFGRVLIIRTGSVMRYFLLSQGKYAEYNVPKPPMISIHMTETSRSPVLFDYVLAPFSAEGDKVDIPYDNFVNPFETLIVWGYNAWDTDNPYTFFQSIYNITSGNWLLPANDGKNNDWCGEIALFAVFRMADGSTTSPSRLQTICSDSMFSGITNYCPEVSVRKKKYDASGVGYHEDGNEFVALTRKGYWGTAVTQRIRPYVKISIDFAQINRDIIESVEIYATRIHSLFDVENMKSKATVASDIAGLYKDNDLPNQPFYRIKTIPIDDFSIINQKDVTLDYALLSNAEQNPIYEPTQSLHSLLPDLYMEYNGRAHFADLTTTLFKGYDFSPMMLTTAKAGHSIYTEVTIKVNNQDHVVVQKLNNTAFIAFLAGKTPVTGDDEVVINPPPYEPPIGDGGTGGDNNGGGTGEIDPVTPDIGDGGSGSGTGSSNGDDLVVGDPTTPYDPGTGNGSGGGTGGGTGEIDPVGPIIGAPIRTGDSSGGTFVLDDNTLVVISPNIPYAPTNPDTGNGSDDSDAGDDPIVSAPIPIVGNYFATGFNTLSYPDYRATRLRILHNDGTTTRVAFDVKLRPSTAANFAYADTTTWGKLQANPKYFRPSVASENAQPASSVLAENYTYREVNRIQASGANNIFSIPFATSYRIGADSDKVIAMNSVVQQLSDAKFGEFPLYVFTDSGIFAMQTGSGLVLYSSIIPISKDIAINPNTIATGHSVLYIASDGLKALSREGSRLLSEPIHDSGNMPPDTLLNAKLYFQHKYNEIIVHPNGYNYAYVYSLSVNCWSTRDFRGRKLNTDTLIISGYPPISFVSDGQIMTGNDSKEIIEGLKKSQLQEIENELDILDPGTGRPVDEEVQLIADFDEELNIGGVVMRIVTRPLKFGSTEYKRVETVIVRLLSINDRQLTIDRRARDVGITGR